MLRRGAMNEVIYVASPIHCSPARFVARDGTVWL